MSAPFDLVVSAVLFRTAPDEVERFVAQVRAVPGRTLLILIDNDPDQPPRETEEGDLLRVWPGRNLGYGAAHNLAFARARDVAAPHLVANTDVRFAPDAVTTLQAVLRGDPGIGLVAPRVRYPDGRLQHLCRLFPTPFDLVARRFFGRFGFARQRNRRYELQDWAYDRPASIPFLSGCFLLIRREIVARVAGFDERFFLYFEDLDLSRRIGAIAGTHFVPSAEIVHDYRSKQYRWRTLRHLIRNGIRYFNKWGWVRDPARDRINAATLSSLDLLP